MIIQNTDPLKQLIRYEEQLKTTIAKIEVYILDDNPVNNNSLKDLIAEEEQLVKYLEVESSKLTPESRQIYMRNLQRYKKKGKQHRDYIGSNYGKGALPISQQAIFMRYQNQNAALAQNKITMYENQRIQDNAGRQLHEQGQKLYGGIEQNREIRGQASQAQSAIHLIQLSIMKRKIMFGSLIVLFIAAFILVLILKAKKK